jgi:hypothetical protein
VDLQLYFRVLWRFRLLAILGFLLASLLAVLAVVRVDTTGGSVKLQYREAEQWVSRSTVLVTERKFPLGRSVFEETIQPTSTDRPTTYAPEFAPPSRFTELANIYAELAMSDAVRQLMLRDGPIRGGIQAVALKATNGSDAPLPMLSIGGLSTTPEEAMRVANRGTSALREYIEAQQRANGIPEQQRVVLTVVNEPQFGRTELLSGRSMTMPLVIFMVAMFGTFGLAFLLENLRPRVRPTAVEAQLDVQDAPDPPLRLSR